MDILQSRDFEWCRDSSEWYVTLTLEEVSVDRANNYSTIRYALKVMSFNHEFVEEPVRYSISLNNQIVSEGITPATCDCMDDIYETILEGTAYVYHDRDGSLDMMPVVFSVDMNQPPTGSVYIQDCYYEGTMSLSPIDMKSNRVNIVYLTNNAVVTNSKYSVNKGIIYLENPRVSALHCLYYDELGTPMDPAVFRLEYAPGYTFVGWRVLSTGTILSPGTNYDSEIYAHYNDKSKTTENTRVVTCYLIAVWKSPNGIVLNLSANLVDTSNSGLWLDDYCKAHLVASATSDAGNIVSYTWDYFENGGREGFETTTSALSKGSYTWYCTVRDAKGNTETASISVEVLPVSGDVYIPYVCSDTGKYEPVRIVTEDGDSVAPVIGAHNSILGQCILGHIIL